MIWIVVGRVGCCDGSRPLLPLLLLLLGVARRLGRLVPPPVRRLLLLSSLSGQRSFLGRVVRLLAPLPQRLLIGSKLQRFKKVK